MHQTSFPRPEAPPLLLRLRAGLASALLSTFGLKPSARRERWLATVTAHAAARQPNDNAVADAARRRLASLTDGALMRHRASRETLTAITQARAALPTLAKRGQDAAEESGYANLVHSRPTVQDAMSLAVNAKEVVHRG